MSFYLSNLGKEIKKNLGGGKEKKWSYKHPCTDINNINFLCHNLPIVICESLEYKLFFSSFVTQRIKLIPLGQWTSIRRKLKLK